MTALEEIAVAPLVAIEARRIRDEWPWARENRALIEAHWQGLLVAKPALYNGRVLVKREQSLSQGVLRLRYSETDYASFIAFRDHGFPDPGAGNSFAMAALRSSDGAYLLGRMADHTANAGRIYFPSGTPDPDDVLPDGAVDLPGSVLRELEEETGLRADEVKATDRWFATFAGARTAMMREVWGPGSAEELRARIETFLAKERHPELCAIHIVRTIADIEDAMPPFQQAFLRFALAS